ncbi:MAG: CDC27 family protein [Chromatiales bacterium]|nr:CDC27 family protein [Chromatiales bacterium]
MTRAAEEAYRDGRYQQAIDLAELIAAVPYTGDSYNLHSLKAHSYFKLGRYQDAEAAYQALLLNYKPDLKVKTQIDDNLAISVYNQATAAKSGNATTEAIRHYVRMSDPGPLVGHLGDRAVRGHRPELRQQDVAGNRPLHREVPETVPLPQAQS